MHQWHEFYSSDDWEDLEHCAPALDQLSEEQWEPDPEFYWELDGETEALKDRELGYEAMESLKAMEAAEANKAFTAFMAATPIVDLTPQWLKSVRRIEQLLAQ